MSCGTLEQRILNNRREREPGGRAAIRDTRYAIGAFPTDRRYTGQREEAGLGLYDYGARFYDPLLARFISADTIVPAPSSPQALNRYSYCLGNPVRYSDPTGHAADAGGGAGLTIEELLAIYERLYNEAPDALDPKGYHGWLKEYYNRKAALYQQLVEGRTPEEIEAAGAHVEQAYGNLLRNGYYGQRIGLAAAYDAAGGSSTVAFTTMVGFTELTRGVLIQQTREAGGKSSDREGSIWTPGKSGNPVRNAFEHWKKHASEFPEYNNAKQYVEGALDFVNDPPAGTLTKARPNGDVLFYHPPSNTFAVTNAAGALKTMFRPEQRIDYWNAQ